jgi:hypothetical protein
MMGVRRGEQCVAVLRLPPSNVTCQISHWKVEHLVEHNPGKGVDVREVIEGHASCSAWQPMKQRVHCILRAPEYDLHLSTTKLNRCHWSTSARMIPTSGRGRRERQKVRGCARAISPSRQQCAVEWRKYEREQPDVVAWNLDVRGTCAVCRLRTTLRGQHC